MRIKQLVLSAALIAGWSASAQAIDIPAPCPTSSSFPGDPISCVQGDKKYDITILDVSPTEILGFSTADGGDTHRVTVTSPGPGSSRNGFFTYTVTVLDPTKDIVKIALEATFDPDDISGVFIFKNIYTDATQTELIAELDNRGGATSVVVSGDSFYIVDEWRIADNADTVVFSNVFSQTPGEVPVPATLVLFGAALAGLGIVRRGRRRAAA